SGGFAGVVTLRDRALSTSGTLGQWSEIAGQRFGHVLDPRSGWPLTRRRQALVVAPDATLAEVLSTSLLVLGEREGIALVEEREGCEGLLLDAEAGAWQTSGFGQATAFEPLPGFDGLTAPLSP
ncbi:MAG: FAD:protein FMN transferase, partial [Myxococcota bacterium]